MIVPSRSIAFHEHTRATAAIGPVVARKRIELTITVVSTVTVATVATRRESAANSELPLAKLDGPAACESKRYDPNLWYSDDESDTKMAIGICLGECSQQGTCLAGAFERNEPHGVFGGMTAVQRRIHSGLQASADDEDEMFAADLSRYEMWSRGRTDVDIAAILGVTHNSVQKWRARNGLSPNGTRGRQASDAIADIERRELYEQGHSDRHIAVTLAISTQAITRWRKRAGLVRHGSLAEIQVGQLSA